MRLCCHNVWIYSFITHSSLNVSFSNYLNLVNLYVIPITRKTTQIFIYNYIIPNFLIYAITVLDCNAHFRYWILMWHFVRKNILVMCSAFLPLTLHMYHIHKVSVEYLCEIVLDDCKEIGPWYIRNYYYVLMI